MIETVVIIHWHFAADDITRRPAEKITHSGNISGNDRSKTLLCITTDWTKAQEPYIHIVIKSANRLHISIGQPPLPRQTPAISNASQGHALYQAALNGAHADWPPAGEGITRNDAPAGRCSQAADPDARGREQTCTHYLPAGTVDLYYFITHVRARHR